MADYWSLKSYEVTYQWEESHLPKTAKTVLDVGCNAAYGTEVLSAHGRLVVGLDIDKTAIIRNVKRLVSNTCYTACDIFALPAKCVDAVVCNNVIEHIRDDAGFLHQLGRLIKDDGTVFITTPNAHERLKDGELPFNPLHLREYTRSDFAKLLQSQFQHVDIYGLYPTPTVAAWFKKRIERRWGLRYAVYLPEIIKKPLRLLWTLLFAPASKGNEGGDDFTIAPIDEQSQGEPMDFIAICSGACSDET